MQELLRKAAKKISRTLQGWSAFQDERYDRQLYDRTLPGMRPWTSSDIVFDIGANDGRTALRLIRHLPAQPRIFSFEPVGSTYQTLVERTSSHPNVRCFQLGMGAEAGPKTMYLHDISAMNSVNPESNPDWGRRGRTETIQITTLDRFTSEQHIEKIHLLKIDVEGHDLEVLQGGENALSAGLVDFIQIECGISPGRQPSLEEVRTHLNGFDYHLYSIDNQARGRPLLPNGERVKPLIMSYCDAIFVSGRHAAA
ncbi:MAG TPA: FkbM family methyltransferase [Falsiroseomonas sp.]|jgi:FkbM family methyltransferase|nr:FkbM family methyltransferase [Falsiroseomonas sp.]